jgi:predicted heme/steroid binding protein
LTSPSSAHKQPVFFNTPSLKDLFIPGIDSLCSTETHPRMALELTPEVLAALVFAVVLALVLSGVLNPSPAKKPAKKGPVKLKKAEAKKFTLEEIAKHNHKGDCWIIVNNKVYDVTAYIDEHPGGEAILRNAGKDSTAGVMGPQHAASVLDMMEYYRIGDVDAQ